MDFQLAQISLELLVIIYINFILQQFRISLNNYKSDFEISMKIYSKLDWKTRAL